ncbi:hypothetical protein D3C81_18070 [compost metagenome]
MLYHELYRAALFIKHIYINDYGKLDSRITRVYLARREDPDGMIPVVYDWLCGGYPRDSLITKLSTTIEQARVSPGVWMPKKLEEMLFASPLESMAV